VSGIETFSVEANGLSIGGLRRGTGNRLMVLLHGFPDRAETMVPLMERLDPDRFTMVAPALRGYPPTDCPSDDRYFLCDLAEDLLGLIEALGFGSADVVGHDWGAPIAYATANLEPSRIRSIVGMAVPPVSVFFRNLLRDPSQLVRSSYMLTFQVPWVSRWWVQRDDFVQIERFYERWSPGLDNAEEHVEAVKDQFRDPDRLRAAMSYYRDLFRGFLHDPRSYGQSLKLSFQSLSVPTLVLAGEEDGCVAPEGFAGTGESNSHVDWEVVPEAGHFMQLERPDYLCERIQQHLAEITQ
jgi:pimeloyl-ACP methyl ester carboxylesterase